MKMKGETGRFDGEIRNAHRFFIGKCLERMIKEMQKELSVIIEKQVVRMGGIWKWIKNVSNGRLCIICVEPLGITTTE
jgi:hypothetical protein